MSRAHKYVIYAQLIFSLGKNATPVIKRRKLISVDDRFKRLISNFHEHLVELAENIN